jgi:hypothetical protein
VVILDRVRHSAIMVALDASNGDIHRVQNLCAEIDYLAISLKISEFIKDVDRYSRFVGGVGWVLFEII